jgi:hypothetical protein
MHLDQFLENWTKYVLLPVGTAEVKVARLRVASLFERRQSTRVLPEVQHGDGNGLAPEIPVVVAQPEPVKPARPVFGTRLDDNAVFAGPWAGSIALVLRLTGPRQDCQSGRRADDDHSRRERHDGFSGYGSRQPGPYSGCTGYPPML